MTQPLYMSSAKRMHERISALAPLIEEAKSTTMDGDNVVEP